MRFKYFLFFSLLSFIIGNQLFGQTVNTRQLNDELANGNVTLISANGTGYISSVSGRLRNNTANDIRINIIVNNGLYLANSGVGQNMLILAVLTENNRYTSGTTNYITLPANATTNVTFRAYCTNRDKDAPIPRESFTRVAMPSNLRLIAEKLSNYYTANFGSDDLSKTVQVAVWRAQGETTANIAATYEFTKANWTAASNLLGLTDPPDSIITLGTYSYNSSYTVTITSSGFIMNWGGSTYNGFYMIIGDTLVLQSNDGPDVFTITSSNAIRDQEGDLWNRR